MINSRLSRLAAAPLCSESKFHHKKGHPLSLSYGVNLPSSLTWFLSRTLGFSPHLPVSVYGTDSIQVKTLRSFSWQHSISQSASSEDSTSHRLSELVRRICLSELPTSLDHHFQSVADLTSCVTPLLKHQKGSTGIFNLLSIAYAFRPRLRCRLTLGGRTLPRKP